MLIKAGIFSLIIFCYKIIERCFCVNMFTFLLLQIFLAYQMSKEHGVYLLGCKKVHILEDHTVWGKYLVLGRKNTWS